MFFLGELADGKSLELRYIPPVTSKVEFLTNQGFDLSNSDSVRCSTIRLVPHTSDIWYIMDSEKYETMSATVKLLREKIRVYHS